MNILYGRQVIQIPLFKTVQARTHRKKRINKKWRKRYGTALVQIRPRMDEVYTTPRTIFVPEEMWDSFIKAIRATEGSG